MRTVQEVPITHGNYISLMEHKDRRIRRDAFHGPVQRVPRSIRNTLAAAFSANVKQAVFYAKARKYASSRQYYLAENEVPELVYDNLVAGSAGRTCLCCTATSRCARRPWA